MSTPNPSPSNLEQQHKLAKDLFRAAHDGDPAALARIRAVRPDAGMPARELKLADAQFTIAREAGFDSWPRLVAELQERDVAAFRDAVQGGDAHRAQRLLAMDHVRARINDPMFDFGQRATHIAAKNEALLTTLLESGADVNLKSDWDKGPFTVLDRADEPTARFLLARGARLTPNVAARLGWGDELRSLVDADPSLVHARGGDGQQPLHEARTVAIADFLLDRGAGVNVRCIDHKSTPAQYALVDRTDVCRRLLDRGATPDIFMAAYLGDRALATRLLDADPSCAAARVNEPGYELVPPLSIYCWSLGFGVSPHYVARRFGHEDVYELLVARSPVGVRFINAVEAGDEEAAEAILADTPTVVSSLARKTHSHLAYAIFYERFDVAHVMLRLGFDPSAPGMDGGSALHAACWVGNLQMVERILERGAVGINDPDPTHQSPPIGWAAFGSVHRRARGADYAAVIDRLVAAGADITVQGNRSGRTLVAMAQGNPGIQEVLRRHGAR